MTDGEISPLLKLAGTVLVCLLLAACGDINDRFKDTATLARITEVDFPAFSVCEIKEGNKSFTGDFTNQMKARFTTMPGDEFYRQLRESREWHEEGEGTFVYNRIWGNGEPAPNGENDEEDMFLTVRITVNELDFIISYGIW